MHYCTFLKCRQKACESHVLVQWTKASQKILCGRLSLTVYSSVVIFQVPGVPEELLFFILKATVSIMLTCSSIELRMWFLWLLVYPLKFSSTSFSKQPSSNPQIYSFTAWNIFERNESSTNEMWFIWTFLYVYLLQYIKVDFLCWRLLYRLEQFNDVLLQENKHSSCDTSSPLFDLTALHAIANKQYISVEALKVCLVDW